MLLTNECELLKLIIFKPTVVRLGDIKPVQIQHLHDHTKSPCIKTICTAEETATKRALQARKANRHQACPV